jgi:hypothetical protein
MVRKAQSMPTPSFAAAIFTTAVREEGYAQNRRQNKSSYKAKTACLRQLRHDPHSNGRLL